MLGLVCFLTVFTAVPTCLWIGDYALDNTRRVG